MPVPDKKCCPPLSPGGPPLTYINNAAQFWNTYTNSYMILTGSAVGTAVSAYLGMCALTQAAPLAYGSPVTPIDCPCCNSPYVWDHQYETCFAMSLSTGIYGSSSFRPALKDPVPCIACICPDPVPPPPPCVTCSQPTTMPVHFIFNQASQKVCTDCGVIGEPTGIGTGADTFMPIQLLDPIINFKRTF